MIGGFHGVGRERKIGKLAGIFILALIEDKAVFVFLVQQLVGVGENLLSLFIKPRNGMAINHELVNAAQEIAVKGHAVRVCRIFFRGFRSVRLRHAHPQQHIRGGLRILRTYQRRGGIDPDIPILGL